MLKIWQDIPKFEYNQRQGAFRSWIYVIARNTAYNYFRRSKFLNGKEEDISLFLNYEEKHGLTEESIEEEWKRHITTLAFKKISSKVSQQKIDIFKAFVEGKKIASIAEEFSLEEHKVYRYRNRVKELLKIEIKNLKALLE